MAEYSLGPNAEAVTVHPKIAHVLSGFDREQLSAFIAIGIEIVDAIDGDPDSEDNGDEDDGSFGEDEPAARFASMDAGPGCGHADPDAAVDDSGCDEDSDREHEDSIVAEWPVDQTEGPLPDDPGADRALMRPHLDRIRRARCNRIEHRGWNGMTHVDYRLRDG